MLLKNVHSYTLICSFNLKYLHKQSVLAPKVVHCDFEKRAIKAFKMNFPGVKIQGCHFHFSDAIFKKVVYIGLGSLFSGKDSMDALTSWKRMCMAFSFLMLGQI